MRTSYLLSVAASLLVLSAGARAAADPIGDLLPSFTGTAKPALDLVFADVTLNKATNKFTLQAQAAGAIAGAANVTYVFGFNTGAAGASPFASLGFPDVRFDTTVQLRANGTGVAAGQALDVNISNDIISAVFDASFLPSKGFATDKYQWAVWSIDSSIAGLARNADFAPTGSTLVNTVPEPQSFALAGIGLAAFGLISRRKKAAAAERAEATAS